MGAGEKHNTHAIKKSQWEQPTMQNQKTTIFPHFPRNVISGKENVGGAARIIKVAENSLMNVTLAIPKNSFKFWQTNEFSPEHRFAPFLKRHAYDYRKQRRN